MIVKRGRKFRVVSEHGNKNLGESDTKEGAVKRLRQVEYFKHHSKAIVDPELVKGRQFLPVVFQSTEKKSDEEGAKLDFPSTGKQMDLRDVKQPEFPSAPFPGEPLASTFGNLRPSAPVKDGAIVSIQPSSGKYAAGSYRGEHGPDTQYKGSDHVPEDVKKKARARKSITIAGRKVVLHKGEGGDNSYLRDSYPIDKDSSSAARIIDPAVESQKRKDWFRQEELKRKQDEYDKAQRDKSRQKNFGDPKSITHDPNIAYLGRSKSVTLKKGNKSIANIVLQYTQAQPLAAAFKPLIAYLVKDDDKKKDKNDSLKVTTFTGAHVGKTVTIDRDKYSPGEMNRWVDPKKRREVEKINPHMPKAKFENFGEEGEEANKETEKSKTSYEAGRKRMGYIHSRLKLGEKEGDVGKYFSHEDTQANRRIAQHDEASARKFGKEEATRGLRSAAGDIAAELKKKEMKERYGKSEMPETSLPPKEEKTHSPAGTWVLRIKKRMAELDKLKEEDKKEVKKAVIGPFRSPEGKQKPEDSEYGKELRERARLRKEQEKVKAQKAETKKAVDPDPIKGGKGDKLQYDDVDEKELEVGTKIEQEHVGKNDQMSDEEKAAAGADIALDHLAEDDKYYTNLVEMERKAKEEKKNETKKKRLLNEAVDNARKSVIKERKLEEKVRGAEKMSAVRDKVGGSPFEMKVTRGQLRAYSKKLAAERRKNQELLRASQGVEKSKFKGYTAAEYFKNTGKSPEAQETAEEKERLQMEKGGFKDQWIRQREAEGKDPLKTPDKVKKESGETPEEIRRKDWEAVKEKHKKEGTSRFGD